MAKTIKPKKQETEEYNETLMRSCVTEACKPYANIVKNLKQGQVLNSEGKVYKSIAVDMDCYTIMKHYENIMAKQDTSLSGRQRKVIKALMVQAADLYVAAIKEIKKV